jgi:hypothetical protein
MDQHQSHGNSVRVSQRPYKAQADWGILSSGFSNETTPTWNGMGAAEGKEFVPCLDPASDDSDSNHQPGSDSGQPVLSNNQQTVVKKRRKQPDTFGKPQISFHFEKADGELRKSKSEPEPTSSNHSSADEAEADLNENSSNRYGYEDPDSAAAASRLQSLTLGRSTGSRQIPVTKVNVAPIPTTNKEGQQPRRQHNKNHRSVANKQGSVGDRDKSRPLQDRGSSNQNPYGYGDPEPQPAQDSNPYGYGDPDEPQPVQDSNPYGYGDPDEPQPAQDSNPYGYGDPEPQPARPSRGRRQYSRRGSVTKFSIQASNEVLQKCDTPEETTYKSMTSQNGTGEPFFPFSSRGPKNNTTTMECRSVQALQGLMMKSSSQRSISDSRRSGSIGALRINPSLPNAGSEVFNPSWRSSSHFSPDTRSKSLRSVLDKALSETGSMQVDLPGQSAPLQDSTSSLPSPPLAKTQSLRSLYRQGRRSIERDPVDDGNLHVLLDESLDASLSNVLDGSD